MSLLSNIFNKSKGEVSELKKDVEALVKFNSDNYTSFEQKNYNITSSNSFDSTKFDDEILIQMWTEVPDISTVISKITDRAKLVPWHHFKVKNSNSFDKFENKLNQFLLGKTSYRQLAEIREQEFEPIFDAEVDKLLVNPNNLQTWGEQIEQLISYYYVLGNSYTIKLGLTGFVPDELKVMHSQQTKPIANESFIKNPFQINTDESEINHYEYDNDNGNIITVDADLVAHMKATNLLFKKEEWVKGFAPLASAILTSKTLKHEYISRLSLVRDRGMMGMVVGDGRSGTQPTAEETKALYERLQKFGLGDGKQNTYAATNGSYKWLNMSFNSGELELLKGREENLKTLARKFNVPTDILIGDSTFNNVTTAGRIIYTSNVIPWLNDYSRKLNNLLGLTEKGQIIMPVYDNIPELQQDLKTQTEIMTMQYESGIATREEARKGVGRSEEAKTDNYIKNNSNNNITE